MLEKAATYSLFLRKYVHALLVDARVSEENVDCLTNVLRIDGVLPSHDLARRQSVG